MLRWLTAGESHGPALVAVLEGLPAGVHVTSKDIQAALKSPELKEAFAREGAAAVTMTTEEFGAYMESEMAKWAKVVKEGNIKPQ